MKNEHPLIIMIIVFLALSVFMIGLIEMFYIKKKTVQKDSNQVSITSKTRNLFYDVYNHMNPKYVDKVFYDGKEDAAIVFQGLCDVFYGDSESFTREQVEFCAFFYIQVWIRKHGGFSTEFMKTTYIIDRLKERFPESDPKKVEEAVKKSVEYIYRNEPDLEKTDDVGSFDMVYSVGAEIEHSEDYSNHYREGFFLFETGRFSEAIASYEKCIEAEPLDTAARFEIVESYIKLGESQSGLKTLMETPNLISSDKDKARFYRRVGFIEIENKNYNVARACYLYSLRFENNPTVFQELEYIESISGANETLNDTDIERILKNKEMLFWNEQNGAIYHDHEQNTTSVSNCDQ